MQINIVIKIVSATLLYDINSDWGYLYSKFIHLLSKLDKLICKSLGNSKIVLLQW